MITIRKYNDVGQMYILGTIDGSLSECGIEKVDRETESDHNIRDEKQRRQTEDTD